MNSPLLWIDQKEKRKKKSGFRREKHGINVAGKITNKGKGHLLSKPLLFARKILLRLSQCLITYAMVGSRKTNAFALSRLLIFLFFFFFGIKFYIN